MNDVQLRGVVELLPQIYENEGKIPLVFLQLRVVETITLSNGSAQNVSTYFRVRCFGVKYLTLLKTIIPGTELEIKGRLGRSQYVSKEGVRNDVMDVLVNDEYGEIKQANSAIKRQGSGP